MHHLYLDNYRGFSKQTIPMENVNFLVGENGTGKTSLLAAIKILRSAFLSSEVDFNDKIFSLGNFKDIASAKSKVNKFYLGCSQINEERQSIVIAKFRNQNGLAVIDYIASNHSNHIYVFYNTTDKKHLIDQESETIQFKRVAFRTNPKIIPNKDFFKKFISIVENDKSKIKTADGVPSRFPVPIKIFRAAQVYRTKISSISPPHILAPEGAVNGNIIAPIRAKPERYYAEYAEKETYDGSHIPYFLKKQLTSKSKKYKDIVMFGKLSGLFSSINHTENSDNIFALLFKLKKNAINYASLGFGVSQILPIIIDMIYSKNVFNAVQQPEVHLHPKAQSAFGEFAHEVISSNPRSKKSNKPLNFIETHSDFIIDRFRLSQKKSRTKVESQVLFFERDLNDTINVSAIKIEDDGKYSKDQPTSFRSFFIKETIDLIEI